MGMRRCSRCGGIYDEVFFRRTRTVSAIADTYSDRRPVCIGCEQTGRDERKRQRRSLVKARNALRTHANKYILAGTVTTQSEFAERFDWDIKQMAHDIDHTASNGCQRCRRSFKSMGNGLSDVSLDIIDPKKLPYYRTNVRWICRTCNSAKSDIDPDEDGRRLEAWAKWEKRQAELAEADPNAGTLFEGLDWAG